MKSICPLLLLLFLVVPSVEAATCRAGEAAARGGQIGYETDADAAEEAADKTLSFADVLEQCVGSITGASTSPSFGGGGGLGSIVEDLFNRVCRVARDKVQGELADDRKRRMAVAMTNIYRQLPASATAQPSIGNASKNGGAGGAVTNQGSASGATNSSSLNLQNIWR